MNATGLNIIKTLGCMTAVTFFTIYNTGIITIMTITGSSVFNLHFDHRHTVIFVVAGYLDGQSRHGTRWQLDKIKRPVIVFLFWVTIYYLWSPTSADI